MEAELAALAGSVWKRMLGAAVNGGDDKVDGNQPRKPGDRLFRSLAFILMVELAVWVAGVAIFIEAKNVAAGSYLPRSMEIDAGTWRVSRDGTLRDEFRAMIKSVGLLQFPMSVLLIFLATYHLAARRSIMVAAFGFVTGVTALGLAIQRGYFSSLGS